MGTAASGAIGTGKEKGKVYKGIAHRGGEQKAEGCITQE